MSPPTVTVVIATYDYAEVVGYAIRSVLAQTFTDFELLVIGDACTDRTGEVVAGFEDDRVRWMNLEVNTGHQCGPNDEGLLRARGRYLAYLGHDDLWLPHHLETVTALLDAGAAVAQGQIVLLDRSGVARLRPREARDLRFDDWYPTSLAHRVDLARTAGGWRHPRELTEGAPDNDLISRILALTDVPPAVAPTITGVKFPAAARRNVYRTRPSYEQARWWATISGSDDPEREVRSLVGRRPPFVTRARTVAWRTYHRVVPRPPDRRSPMDHHRDGRRYRGLPDR